MEKLRARFVFPIDRPPIEDGVVVFRHDRIVAVEPYSGQAGTGGISNTAIVPGFVNAHAHLEFSDLKRPLGAAGMPFVDWIRAVVDYRRRVQSEPDRLNDLRWPYARPVEEGLREAIASGTTAIGDIAASPPTVDLSAIDVTPFLELRGLRDSGVDDQIGAAAAFLRMPFGCRKGLSPHAPYTVSLMLLERAVALCQMRNVPLAMHLAESREEIELLQTGGGPFRDLLVERGVCDEDALPRARKPLDYLQRLSAAARSLVIHGNYLDDEEIDFLGEYRERMSLVYCPRTHAYFGHEPHPWRKMLDRGVQVAIGTDSRASNPDLSMLVEVRFLAHRCGASAAEALRLGTLGGAQALGIDQECGTLSPGKWLTLVIIKLPDDARGDPYEQLLDPKSRPVVTFYRGQLAYSQRTGWR